MEKHVVKLQDAAKIWSWIASRGGIAIWQSINLSNPGISWTTPVRDEEGVFTTKPTWQSSNEPSRIITDPSEVLVSQDREVKRFHVGIRLGTNGLMLKCTDGASRRIRREVEKAGEGAYYKFDYLSQDAVIFAPDKQSTLVEWFLENKNEEGVVL